MTRTGSILASLNRLDMFGVEIQQAIEKIPFLKGNCAGIVKWENIPRVCYASLKM